MPAGQLGLTGGIPAPWSSTRSSRADLVHAPVDQGSLSGDVRGLVGLLSRPLTARERAVGALLARCDEQLRPMTRRVIDDAVEEALRELLRRGRNRGELVRTVEPPAVGVFVLRAQVLDRLAGGPVDEDAVTGVAALLDGLLARAAGRA